VYEGGIKLLGVEALSNIVMLLPLFKKQRGVSVPGTGVKYKTNSLGAGEEKKIK